MPIDPDQDESIKCILLVLAIAVATAECLAGNFASCNEMVDLMVEFAQNCDYPTDPHHKPWDDDEWDQG